MPKSCIFICFSVADSLLHTINSDFRYYCRRGNLDCVKNIVENYDILNPNTRASYGFRIACNKGYLKIAKYLVEKFPLDSNKMIRYDSKKWNAFRMACCNGHLNVVKWLVKTFRVDPHHCNEEAFSLACKNGHLNVVKYFLV